MTISQGLDWRAIITVEPDKCYGRPCIRGMRIKVTEVLGLMAAGLTSAEILSDDPDLTQDDITAWLRYAVDRLDHLVVAI